MIETYCVVVYGFVADMCLCVLVIVVLYGLFICVCLFVCVFVCVSVWFCMCLWVSFVGCCMVRVCVLSVWMCLCV